MRPVSPSLVLGATLAMLLAASLGGAASRPVSVTDAWHSAEVQAARARLLEQLTTPKAPAAPPAPLGGLPATTQVLRLHPLPPRAGGPPSPLPQMWVAILYDYASETGYRLELGNDGSFGALQRLGRQPNPTRAEIENAIGVLRRHPLYGPLLASGALAPYAAMPPVDYAPGTRRTLHIGLRPAAPGSAHEIVGVQMATSSVISYAAATSAPFDALATEQMCGVNSDDTCAFEEQEEAGSGIMRIRWPATGEAIWELTVVRPSATISELSNGAGVELREVRYRGDLILLRAHVPVLNVKYEEDRCGPYRDWLSDESCIVVDVTQQQSPGFYASSTPAGTICQTAADTGNARGVVVESGADSLTLTSEMMAGWYRYLNGWRLHENGDVEAIFQYAGTVNSCMCHKRVHHAYWRFDWALKGQLDAAGVWKATTVFERQPAAAGTWKVVDLEEQSFRQTGTRLRVVDKASNAGATLGYELVPGAADGTAAGDPFAKADLWLLDWNELEIGDLGFDAIDLDPFLDSGTLGGGRLVMWYGAHIAKDGNPPAGGALCSTVGPTLRRVTAFP